ncbi:MAG: hypothetical protein U1G05_16510 [Kiritimatiellia bacterium]
MIEHAPPGEASPSVISAHGVQVRDFDRFDLLLVMDDFNERDLLAMTTRHTHKARIRKMTDFCVKLDAADVPDPAAGGPGGL